MTAVSQLGSALRYASEELRADREVVLTALKKDFNGDLIKFANKILKQELEKEGLLN